MKLPFSLSTEDLMFFIVPFAAITLLTAAALFFVRDLVGGRKRGIDGRLNGNANGGNGNGNGQGIPQLVTPGESNGGGFFARMENWFERLYFESGMGLGSDMAFMYEMAAALFVGGAVYIWLDDMLAAVFGAIAGFILVVGIFLFLRARRRKAICEQLPDVVEHIARAVRAGRTVDQAFELVGQTSPQPLGIEFRRCAGQMGMGLSVDATMRSLTRRVPIEEMRILASTFIVQRRAGGNLPTTLERVAHVIRDRLSYHRQFNAATAGSRLSLIILSLAGPAVVTYMLIWRREFIDRFFESPLGILLLITAIVLYLAGFFWAYRLLRTNY